MNFQYFQCLQHRALNPDDPLPELSPLIANYLKPPEEVVASCSESVDKLKKKFKLEVVKKKEEKTGENVFKEKLVFWHLHLDKVYSHHSMGQIQ